MSKHLKSIAFFAAVALVAVLTACSGNKNGNASVEEQNNQLAEALNRGDYTTASALADTMALYVDDLTPDETVSVLMAFLEFHNQAKGEDLETLRKYVDVYDIALDNNPNDMRAAFNKARSMNPKLDFEKAAVEFRRALAEYDAVKTYGETPVAEPDSAATDSVKAAATTEAAVSEKPELLED